MNSALSNSVSNLNFEARMFTVFLVFSMVTLEIDVYCFFSIFYCYIQLMLVEQSNVFIITVINYEYVMFVLNFLLAYLLKTNSKWKR